MHWIVYLKDDCQKQCEDNTIMWPWVGEATGNRETQYSDTLAMPGPNSVELTLVLPSQRINTGLV